MVAAAASATSSRSPSAASGVVSTRRARRLPIHSSAAARSLRLWPPRSTATFSPAPVMRRYRSSSSASRGSTTSVTPSSTAAGNMKHTDLPEPVGSTTIWLRPSSRLEITNRW